jgi:hypothetical protein
MARIYFLLVPVFRIRDKDSDPSPFSRGFQDANKNNFFLFFVCLLLTVSMKVWQATIFSGVTINYYRYASVKRIVLSLVKFFFHMVLHNGF